MNQKNQNELWNDSIIRIKNHKKIYLANQKKFSCWFASPNRKSRIKKKVSCWFASANRKSRIKMKRFDRALVQFNISKKMHAVRPVLPNRNHVSFVRVQKIWKFEKNSKSNYKPLISYWSSTFESSNWSSEKIYAEKKRHRIWQRWWCLKSKERFPAWSKINA